MKKNIIIINLMLGLQVQAQHKVIQTPFWQSAYSEQQEIPVIAVQSGLVEDCNNYAKFIIENANTISSDDLEFARTLPLRGYMKNSYEVDFRVEASRVSAGASVSQSYLPEFKKIASSIEIDTTTLKDINIVVRTVGALTDISSRFGLAQTKIEIIKNNSGETTALRLRARDLTCDLLNQKLFLVGMAQRNLLLDKAALPALESFYGEISDKTNEILYTTENSFVKAALLGISYSEVFEKNKINNQETKKHIEFLFNRLFQSGSLQLSENWHHVGMNYVINFQKSKQLGYGPIELKVKSL